DDPGVALADACGQLTDGVLPEGDHLFQLTIVGEIVPRRAGLLGRLGGFLGYCVAGQVCGCDQYSNTEGEEDRGSHLSPSVRRCRGSTLILPTKSGLNSFEA